MFLLIQDWNSVVNAGRGFKFHYVSINSPVSDSCSLAPLPNLNFNMFLLIPGDARV